MDTFNLLYFRVVLLLIFYLLYVSSNCLNTHSVTDFGPIYCNSSKNEYYTESILNDDCIAGCVNRSGFGEKCGVYDCAPGLYCDDTIFECVIDPNPTVCDRCKYIPDAKWIPECLLDGTFAPVQRKGEILNGRYFCYDRYGNRIFGEAWSHKANNMTCACSRHRSEIMLKGRNDVTLHCDTMGNYEPLQCESESCWCADPKTGQVLDVVVPKSMMTMLPCYDRTEIGSMYLRKCESQQFAQATIKNEFNTHGTSYVSLSVINCDWDGSYGKVQIENGQVYCAWRDNSNLGSWRGELGELKHINCNCARDTKTYQLAGKQFTQECLGNGNYKPLQQLNETFFYCVDEDGFVIKGPEENLNDCNITIN